MPGGVEPIAPLSFGWRAPPAEFFQIHLEFHPKANVREDAPISYDFRDSNRFFHEQYLGRNSTSGTQSAAWPGACGCADE